MNVAKCALFFIIVGTNAQGQYYNKFGIDEFQRRYSGSSAGGQLIGKLAEWIAEKVVESKTQDAIAELSPRIETMLPPGSMDGILVEVYSADTYVINRGKSPIDAWSKRQRSIQAQRSLGTPYWFSRIKGKLIAHEVIGGFEMIDVLSRGAVLSEFRKEAKQGISNQLVPGSRSGERSSGSRETFSSSDRGHDRPNFSGGSGGDKTPEKHEPKSPDTPKAAPKDTLPSQPSIPMHQNL